eukprot:scaffold1724_cov150-Skeletonema_menzelii.AAC.1
MISKSRTKWYLIECLSAMHLHHRHDDRRRKGWEGKLEHTCFNCGRQFMKKKRSFLHLKKHKHRCPGCHSEFDRDSSVGGATGMDHRSGRSRSGRKNGFRLSVPLLIRSLLAIPSSSTGKEQSDGSGHTTTTTVNCSADNIESDRLDDDRGDGSIRRRKEQFDGDVIVNKNSCLVERDPCPFAFTYDNETVEPYQIHESNDESENHEVETYQLEWLLYDM